MYEKYKIYLTETIKQYLVAEAEQFEFLKDDLSVNLNGFLKALLINYYDVFLTKNMDKRSRVKEWIKTVNSTLSEEQTKEYTNALHDLYSEKNASFKDKKSASVTITVSGRSAEIIHMIESNDLPERMMTLSAFLSDLITSYFSMPRNKREEIIYHSTVLTIRDAIKKKRALIFTTSTAPGRLFTIEPYLLVSSKEEHCNYLLGYDQESTARSFRISRLRELYLSDKPYAITKKKLDYLKATSKKTPGYAFQPPEEIVVAFTEEGKRKYRMIVHQRPEAIKIEGNYYHFYWPKILLEEYLKRFGKDAVVIKPLDLRESLKKYYLEGFKHYEQLG